MIYLDTHVVVWLYAGQLNLFSERGKALLRTESLRISPIVRLEVEYLRQLGRVNATSDAIVADLERRIGLVVCEKPFNTVISHALPLGWTRDPFDRLIVAQASVDGDQLLTKDSDILSHYPLAQW